MLHFILLAFALQAVPSPAHGEFEEKFTGKTLRWSFDHANFRTVVSDGVQPPKPAAAEFEKSTEEIRESSFQVELDWAGSRTQLIDSNNFGKYMFELHDLATGRLLYSRGFCSIFGEWETTPEAKFVNNFAESIRFPEPRQNFRIVVQTSTRSPS